MATGTFPIARAAGKKVRYSGYIKTEGVTRGYAGLWWRVDGPSGVLAFDNMQTRGVTGTTDWTQYTIELPVDASVKNINFGALLPGDGTAWFDDLTIELDGEPFTRPMPLDLDFESSSPRGFYTGGQGYRVQLDTTVRHSGKQSLRMQHVARRDRPQRHPRSTASTAAAAWKAVVAHSSRGRAGYRARGATDRDIEWAMQNARVVLQAMQMRAGQVTARPEHGRQRQVDPRPESEGEDRAVGAQRSRRDRRVLVRDDGLRAAADVRQARWSCSASRSIRDRFRPWRRAAGA